MDPKIERALIDEVSLRHSQKLEAVGRLAAGIAHEINTPIQFVGDNLTFLSDSFAALFRLLETYDRVLAEHLPPNLAGALADAKREADAVYIGEEAPKAIANAQEGVTRVSRIVQAMRSLAHNDQGRRCQADINQALSNTLVVARSEYKYVADVETSFGDIELVDCYLDDLNQVFLNLIINAGHAIGDRVAGTDDRGLIRVETRMDGDHVLISIGDTGSGIPIEIQHRIFEPFFTTKEVGRGSGQGLALARGVVVEKHRGRLWFESELGRGTTFFIRLAVNKPATTDLSA